MALAGTLAFSGIALLTASRARTIEAASGLMNLVMIPMWLLSGAFFSYERFPAMLQPLIRALPLTALIDALRAVIDDGVPLGADLAPARRAPGLGRGALRLGRANLSLAVRVARRAGRPADS